MERNTDVGLTNWMMGLGALCAALGGWCIARPSHAANALRCFPRSRAAAWSCSAAALGWTAWIVHGASLGRFAFLEPWVLPAAPVVLILVNRYMDELLAPRALGGLFLLAANPMLMAVRMHPSAWSRVPALIAYLCILAGIALVLSPHLFRRALAPLLRAPQRLRRAGAILAGSGVAMTLLGSVTLR